MNTKGSEESIYNILDTSNQSFKFNNEDLESDFFLYKPKIAKLPKKKFERCIYCHFKRRQCMQNPERCKARKKQCVRCKKTGHYPRSISCRKHDNINYTQNIKKFKLLKTVMNMRKDSYISCNKKIEKQSKSYSLYRKLNVSEKRCLRKNEKKHMKDEKKFCTNTPFSKQIFEKFTDFSDRIKKRINEIEPTICAENVANLFIENKDKTKLNDNLGNNSKKSKSKTNEKLINKSLKERKINFIRKNDIYNEDFNEIDKEILSNLLAKEKNRI